MPTPNTKRTSPAASGDKASTNQATSPAAKTAAKKATKKTASPAKKAATKKPAAKKAAKKTAAPRKAAPKAKPFKTEQVHAKPSASTAQPTIAEAFVSLANDLAEKTSEQVGVISKQVYKTATELGKQAEGEIEKGKQFLRAHKVEATVGAVSAAAVAALAAARATYKAVKGK